MRSALGREVADPSVTAESATPIQKEASKQISTGDRTAPSNTAPSHRHERPSSAGVGCCGVCSLAGFAVLADARARQCSQQAGRSMLPIECAAANLTAQSYGQSSTEAIVRITRMVRMSLPMEPQQLLV